MSLNIQTKPLISCLCLSYNRPAQLKNAIQNFISQVYPHKELIVVGHKDDRASKQVVMSCRDERIRYYSAPRLPIGELRNMSIDLAAGEYFCQWDDDDWYHTHRLDVQMDGLLKSGKEASVLAYWIMFDTIRKNAYLSPPLMWAGTILCKKSIYEGGARYPGMKKGEDQEFLGKLYALNCAYPIVNPALYIYQFHGNNTWDAKHFNSLFSGSQVLPAYVSSLITKIVSREYPYDESSAMLSSTDLIKEFNYFYYLLPQAVRTDHHAEYQL